MRRWIAGTLVVWAAMLAGTLPGQEAPAGNLLTKVDWVRFEVQFGRLTLFSNRIGQMRLVAAEQQPAGTKESITAGGDAIHATVHYERISPHRSFIFDHQPQGLTTLRDEVTAPDQLSLLYTQPAAGPVSLQIYGDQHQAVYRAASLWHLLIAEPAVCQAHLLPSLERLRPHWRLYESSRQIEAGLFQAAEKLPPPSTQRLQQLVTELDQPSFATRQAADRELRNMGVIVLPFLQRMNTAQLSAEQQFRIRQIQATFQTPVGDTPERVVAWLMDDRAMWLTLLAHQDPACRQAAAEHLSLLAEATIPFDPLAADDERAVQIARLRERFQ